MSLFPAVRGHSAGTNSKSAFSSTASVASIPSSITSASQKALPRIATTTQQQQEFKKPNTTKSASKRDIAPIDRPAAITAIAPSSSAAQLPSASSVFSPSIHTLRTNLFFTSDTDRNAACSLRIVDARLETVDSETSDAPSVWSQLNMEDINANLAAPQTLQEQALNHLSAQLRKGPRTPEQAAAEAAHKAIEVSKLVAHFPVHMGVSMVGSAPRVLLLQFENTFDPFSAAASASASDPNIPASNVGAGEMSWKIRMPPELDSKVEHWASVSSNPTDEERYHQLVVDREIFTIRPRKGKLLPQQGQKVEIVYHPRFVGEHVLPVLFQVRGGKHFSLVLKATTVSTLPASFSLLHLKEYTPLSSRPQTASQQKLLKPAEEQKETQSTAVATANPFLPSATLPIFEHTFHAVPIGLSKEQTPIQTFPLVNHSDQALAYRIYFDSFRQLKANNFNCEIISIVGSNIDGQEQDGQEFLEGRVPPRSTGYIRFRFQPLEIKSYELPVEICVRSEASSDVTKQRLVLRGQGILPKTWALNPFPLAQTSPPHQVLGLPGQLLTVSNEELHFGDTSLFSKTSRLLTLRASTNQIVEFAFVHSLRVPSRRWNASLRAERQLRRVMNEEEGEELFMEDDNDEEDGANSNSANNGLFDPLESVHVNFTPSSGVLEPGQSVQIRVDLHGGDQALILERDIKLYSRVLLDENGQAFSSSQQQQPQLLSPSGRGGNAITAGRSTGRKSLSNTTAAAVGGSDEPLDTFGYNRLPSASLTLRSPISSSQPLTRKSKKVHVHVRDNRWVESVTGVGRGFAGADVRVDFPAKAALPLNTSTITRRNNNNASPTENVLDHLTSSLESMQSVPNRSTWFGDAEGPTRALQQREQHVLHIYLRARILPVSSLERDENERLQQFQPVQQEKEILPQQARTEITSVGSEVSQRIFVPQVDLTTGSAASQAAVQAGRIAHDGHIITDSTGAKAVESALHDLLRAALSETTVGQSFDHLTTEPIPFFADLLGHTKSDHPHSPRHNNKAAANADHAAAASGGSPFSPQSFALPNSSAHFQNVSENILNDTLFLLMVEASSSQTNFDLDTKTLPKTIVVKK